MTEGKRVRSTTEGRWTVGDSAHGLQLTSGHTIEVWLGGQWIEGHVERSKFFVAHKGGYCALCTGMRVRVLRD